MSLYFFEINDQEQGYLTKHLPQETLHFRTAPLTTAEQAREIGADAEIVSPFVHSRLSADIIEHLPHLKMIATRSTGFDHIHLPEAEARTIVVCNVPAYGENTVAEHTFALILSLSRNLPQACARTAAGNFSVEGLQGFDLQGKTLGVVGVGHIGECVLRIAKGFGMRLLAYDTVWDMTKADHFEFTYVSLEELLGRSDIVTLHAPATAGTRHLIGAHNIGQFKRGALLINTARGELVETEALLSALDQGILRGAGLDVLEGEACLKLTPRNRSLLQRPNVVITPHIAFDSAEAVKRILDTTIANIQAFRSGHPQNQVSA